MKNAKAAYKPLVEKHELHDMRGKRRHFKGDLFQLLLCYNSK